MYISIEQPQPSRLLKFAGFTVLRNSISYTIDSVQTILAHAKLQIALRVIIYLAQFCQLKLAESELIMLILAIRGIIIIYMRRNFLTQSIINSFSCYRLSSNEQKNCETRNSYVYRIVTSLQSLFTSAPRKNRFLSCIISTNSTQSCTFALMKNRFLLCTKCTTCIQPCAACRLVSRPPPPSPLPTWARAGRARPAGVHSVFNKQPHWQHISATDASVLLLSTYGLGILSDYHAAKWT